MNQATETQHKAYDELKFSKRDIKQKEVVFEAIKELGCAPRKMLAEYLRLPINVVAGRVNDLIHENRIVVAFHRKFNSRTEVEWLRIARQGEIHFDKRTKLQRILELCQSDYVSAEEIKRIIAA